MEERLERIYLDASTARFFRLGEGLEAGQLLGTRPDGRGSVIAGEPAEVVQIEYDIENEQIILAIVRGTLTACAA